MRREARFEALGNHLYQDTRSQKIYVIQSFKRYRIPKLFQSTFTDKIGKARVVADQLVKDHLNKYLEGKVDGKSFRVGTPFRQIIDEVMLYRAPKKRARTQDNYKLYLTELKREWGKWSIERFTVTAWEKWLSEFKTRKNRETFNDYAKYMNLLLRYAYTQKKISHLITVPSPDPIREETGRVFTTEEITALWTVMNEETRDQFVLCLECMMRLREALYLTWDRVNLEEGTVTLRPSDVKTGSKTGKGRTFRLSPHAWARMKARRQAMPKAKYVFPSPENPGRPVNSNKTAWSLAKEKAGIQGQARWHDLRHTALTMALLDARKDPILVSEYAGVSLKTLQRVYLHSTHEKTASVAGSVRILEGSGLKKG